MKNIAICTRDLDFGVGSVVKNEIKKLERNNEIEKIFVIGPKILQGYSNKVEFIIIGNKGKFFITKEPNFAFKCRKVLTKLIQKEKIDQINIHFPIAAKDFGVKTISKFHTLHKSIIKHHPNSFKFLIGKVFHKIYSYFDLKTIKNSDKVLFVSKRTLEEAKKLYPKYKKNFFYSPNKVDNSIFYKVSRKNLNSIKEKLGFTKDKKNILYVGRLEPMKGINKLASTLEKFNQNKFRLFIIGEGHLKKNLENYSFVNLLGKVKNEEIYKYYNSADLFILPSLYENAPMTILEAKACGCKILASNVGDNKIILGEENIFNNLKELEAKLSKILK